MKEFIIKEGEGELLIHMTASNENYTISYDRGQLKFQNINKTYIIPKNLGYKVIYDKLDTLTNKNKYQIEDIRSLYRDTTPTDFGLSNKTNVSPGSKHTSEEIIVGGINDYIPVVAPEGVTIYVNGNIVGSGTMIYNGDRVKFELIAPSSSGTSVNYNLRVGDISKNVSIQTALQSGISLPTTLSNQSGGVNYTWDGKTFRTTGQFASALLDITTLGRKTGKIYLESKLISGSTMHANSYGIQRKPTRYGNYHWGNGGNGNGGISVTTAYSMITNNVQRIIIDLDKAQLIVDDVIIGTLGGSGDIYFGMYDGTSGDTGVREFYFSPNEFIYPVPADATPWKF